MRVFITGASGYIGGSVAARLLRAGHTVAGLARTEATAFRLRERGVEPVLGTLEDAALLGREAARADAVVNAADSDHRPAIEALIAVLAGTGKTLLHSSGSSIVARDDQGMASERVYYDGDGPPAEPVPQKSARVAIDRAVLAASAQKVTTAVLCNSLIYGTGAGLQEQSIQLPTLAAIAKREGVPRHIGPGLNIWSTVHIDDVADIYELAIRAAAADRLTPGSFFYVENGEANLRDMTAAIGRALGLVGPPEPWPVAQAEAELGEQRARFSLGANSRVRGVRAREVFAWKPQRESVLDWIGRAYKKGDGSAHS